MQGKLILVPHGTPAVVIDSGFTSFHVMIKGEEMFGREGWVTRGNVVKAEP